ncbi:MAG: 16S rRNA (cytidine(1402)-2'-O)-methyltransferase [Lachnospiraceae bacterium]|nr:16S rRNA (cytidine(1402)-2'-O)-methyltransferase [Lachnospiraceae bacterium]
MPGILYLCATPIGNLEDITIRVIRTLKEVDLIAAEDTRNSIKLLNHFEIQTPMTSYHAHNKYDKGKLLVEKLSAGKHIALITDAGTPAISDPGEELVQMCYEAGIQVTSLPGANACLTALSLSGLSTCRFAFEGFLPTDKRERRHILEELKKETRTIIFYEAPHRLCKTLRLLWETLGNRQVVVCRELTKRYETVYLADLEKACAYYEKQGVKGECVLVIAGKDWKQIQKETRAEWANLSMEEHIHLYLEQGIDKKEAMRLVAKDRGISKRDVYQHFISP